MIIRQNSAKSLILHLILTVTLITIKQTDALSQICNVRTGVPCDQTTENCEAYANPAGQGMIAQCYCKSGFKTKRNRFNNDQQTCEDINECEQSNASNLCMSNQDCVNTIGSYKCVCKDGYNQKIINGQVYCNDINECRMRRGFPSGQGYCGSLVGSICTNTLGGVDCECKEGFDRENSERTCQDIDECETGRNTHDCDTRNSYCLNTLGSYECKCKPGYEPDPNAANPEKTCRNINECLDPSTNNCDQIILTNLGINTCYDLIPASDGSGPGYDCRCPNQGFINQIQSKRDPLTGFLEVSFHECQDINECNNPINPCDSRTSRCVNKYGDYYCECLDGYEKLLDNDPNAADNKNMCFDIDECLLEGDQNPCDLKNGFCSNTEGSYECFCNEGFQNMEDKGVCVDIDECQLPTNSKNVHECECSSKEGCGADESYCLNIPGGYECICGLGYELGIGRQVCQDKDECADDPCNRGFTRMECINTLGSFTCQCPSQDYYYEEESKTCKKSGCKNYNRCQPPATCQIDSLGDPTCICPPGYEKSGKYRCRDFNECLYNKHDCQITQTCINLIPGFKCDGPTIDENQTMEAPIEPDFDDDKDRTCMDSMCNIETSYCENKPSEFYPYTCVCLPEYTGPLCNQKKKDQKDEDQIDNSETNKEIVIVDNVVNDFTNPEVDRKRIEIIKAHYNSGPFYKAMVCWDLQSAIKKENNSNATTSNSYQIPEKTALKCSLINASLTFFVTTILLLLSCIIGNMKRDDNYTMGTINQSKLSKQKNQKKFRFVMFTS